MICDFNLNIKGLFNFVFFFHYSYVYHDINICNIYINWVYIVSGRYVYLIKVIFWILRFINLKHHISSVNAEPFL